MHTIGVGSGVSTQLINEAAEAGCGCAYFVYNPDELEETVILALQKNYVSAKLIKSVTAFDENNNSI